MKSNKQLPIILLIILIIACIREINAASLRKGPYLIYPGTNTRMKVLWQADSSPGLSKLEWGTTPAYGNIALPPEYGDHQFTNIISGLTPGIKIFYRITVDADVNVASFFAAPPNNSSSVTFYAYSDSQSGDVTLPSNDHNMIVQQMLQDMGTASNTRQTLVLHSGDWTQDGQQESCWSNSYFNRLLTFSRTMQSKMPVMGARGNHEGDAVLMRKYLPFKYQDPSGFYHSFDYGPVHVAVVDLFVDFVPTSPQYHWLDTDLAQSDKKWKIVLFHRPGWAGGSAHTNDGTVQAYLQPLLKTRGVDIVFAGHNHYYSRCVVDGIQHVTTGGAGGIRADFFPGYPYLVTAEKILHYCRINVNNNLMTVTVIRSNGTTIENFSIDKTASFTPAVIINSPFNGPVYTSPSKFITIVGNASDDQGISSVTYTLEGATTGGGTAQINTYSDVNQTVIPAGSTWRYLDNGTDQGTNWRTTGFNDAGWASGPAKLGYGDPFMATTVSYGPSSANKYVTTFFRHTFNITDTSLLSGSLKLGVVRDDGVAVYLNGTKVFIDDLLGPYNYLTYATVPIDLADEYTFQERYISPALLRAGNNVIAAEIHQCNASSSDISFDLEMTGSKANVMQWSIPNLGLNDGKTTVKVRVQDVLGVVTTNTIVVSYGNIISYSTPIISVFPTSFIPSRHGTAKIYFAGSTPDVEVKIYDVSGNLVRTFDKVSGVKYVDWDGKNNNGIALNSGAYIVHVKGKNMDSKVKMLLLR
jgi:hypothetical protein